MYLPICSAMLINRWENIDKCIVSNSVLIVSNDPSLPTYTRHLIDNDLLTTMINTSIFTSPNFVRLAVLPGSTHIVLRK